MNPGSKPGERLERALEAFLSGRPGTKAEEDTLLRQHPDLADLLEPMLARGHDGDGDASAGEGDAGGERVLGDFRLVRELGRGGMGIVHEAWQRSLDRRVAVKVLAPALVSSPGAVARFRREASAAGRVHHPHIVEVLGFGSAGGEHFFAMQFIDGVPLHDVAERFRAPAAAVHLAAQLADALVHAHAAGLVHRDVKPGNVLVCADGTAMLTDFGVARDESLPSLTRDGGFVGTLDYASPEQVRGDEVDGRCDVWALGVILHELLAGSHPFTAATQEATMHRILTGDPPRLQGRPDVSDDLAAVVDHALQKNRARRYASAAALLADLQALEQGAPVSVRLPTGVERLQRWASREPWRAAAAALLLLGVPTIAAVVGYLWANAPRIEAATLAERVQRREETLARATYPDEDLDEPHGVDALRELPADDVEAAIVRALLQLRAGDLDAARDALRPFTGTTVELVRRFLDSPRVDLGPNATPPGDAFECFVRSFLLFKDATHRGARNRAALRRAIEFATMATILAPTPRLSFLVQLGTVAEAAEDAAGVRSAELALRLHFPDSPVALQARARFLARMQPEAALKLMASFGSNDDLAQRTIVSLGVALEHAGRLDDAIEADRKATQLDPQDASAWNNLGVVLRKAKRLEEATAALRTAHELRPRNAAICNSLALVRRDAGDRDEARRGFEEALELRADYAPAALNLGNLLREEDPGAALDAFRRVVAIEPDNVRAVANLGDTLARLGRPEEALQYSLRAAALAPNDLIPHHNAARLALQLKLPKLALPLAARAREVGKQDPNALEVWAAALLAQDPVDGPQALAAARAADAARKGSHVDARILVGRALAANGDRDGAIANLQAALADLRFSSSSDHDKLAEALAGVRGP